ncbi:MAG: hypothetical protein Q4E18_07420 [Clostridia bacterium]|nr:hypothetical protein [Clostridia bacterium]
MDQLGESIRKLILAGIGAAAVTKEKSEGILKELVKKGELTVEQGKVLNEELKHNLKDAIRDNVTVNVVRPDVMDAVDNMTDVELEALKARIHAAEARRSAEETPAEEAKEAAEEVSDDAPEAEATEETNETESK